MNIIKFVLLDCSFFFIWKRIGLAKCAYLELQIIIKIISNAYYSLPGIFFVDFSSGDQPVDLISKTSNSFKTRIFSWVLVLYIHYQAKFFLIWK